MKNNIIESLFDNDSVDLVPISELPEDLRSQFAMLYTDEQLHEIKISRDKIEALRVKSKMAFGHYQQASILLCTPDRCPYKEMCPLLDIDRAPVGEYCPIEMRKFDDLVNMYTLDIARRSGLEIEELDIVMKNLIRDMVYCDMVIARCNAKQGESGAITELRTTVVNPKTGQNLQEEEPSKLHDIVLRYMKKKEDIYKQLIATPEMVVKLKKKTGDEGSQQLANVTANVKEMLSKIKGGEGIEVTQTKVKVANPGKHGIKYSALPPEPEIIDVEIENE